MRLLLLSCKSKANPLLNILQKERIYFDLLASVAFIAHLPFSKRIYNGVLIDETLIEQCCSDDLVKLERLKKVLPCQAIPSDPEPSQNTELATFFETCKRFPPRSIRQQTRAKLCLPARISTDADFAAPQDTTALNISANGCFLTNPSKQEIGDKLWLNLDDLEDTNPLLGEIRWFSEKSTADLPPGMGVRFLEASSSQIAQLEWLMRRGSISS